MSDRPIDYDSVAEIYDLYVKADYDVPFFLSEAVKVAEKRLLAMEFAFVEKDRFETMARDAGFSVLKLYGNYDRTPFDPERSPVMIWVLARTEAEATARMKRALKRPATREHVEPSPPPNTYFP